MFCKNCGAKLDDDAVFCEKCGTAIKRAASLDSDKNVFAHGSDSDAQRPNEIRTALPAETVAKLKSKRMIIPLAVLAVLVIAVIFVVVNRSAGASDPVSMAESNFTNGGKFAFDDTSLYFFEYVDEDESESCIYSTSYTGKDKTPIPNTSDIRQIRIVNDKILYKKYSSGSDIIGFMEKDGSNDTELVKLPDTSLTDFDASDTTLYYLYDGELRAHPLGDGDPFLISDNVQDFMLADDTLYYATYSSIFSYDIKQDTSTEICSSKAKDLVLDGEELYFKNDSGIYKISIAGDGTPEPIVQDPMVGSFIIKGNTIYYIHMFEEDAIDAYIESTNTYTGTLSSLYDLYIRANLMGCGRVTRVPKTGGNAEAVDSQTYITALFAYPGGIYSMDCFASTPSPAEFE